MIKSRIELSYRFSMPVEGTSGRDGVARYYDCYIDPEDLQNFHEEVKVLAVKYGTIKNNKEVKE